MGKLVKIENNKANVLKPKIFDKEEILQEIVKNFPEIIPLEQIDDSVSLPLVIGRELTLEIAGFIDLLTIDIYGLITIIEFKLEKNPDIRKAVAQVIEYAANLWGMSYADLNKKTQDYFKSERCDISQLKEKTLAQAAKWHFEKIKKEDDEEKFSIEDFILNVSNNLQKGEFRLIVFCDNVDERTKRAVEYLNYLSNFDIFCVSTDAFELDGKSFFKSDLITLDKKKKAPGKKHAGKITFDEFLNSIPADFRETYQYLEKKRQEANSYLSMGTKGFAFYFQINEYKMRPFCGYPDSIELISEKFFNKYLGEEIIPEDARMDYEDRMSKTGPFKNSFKDNRIYPAYKYSKIKPVELKEYFIIIIDWYKKWFA